jgi:hypothetical protein
MAMKLTGANGKPSTGEKLKKIGKFNIDKPTRFVWKFLVVFVVVNILGIISTIWSPALSPKYRSIDRAVASLNIPADWTPVPFKKDSKNTAYDYLGSCRFTKLFDSGYCVINSHSWEADFKKDPRETVKDILNTSTVLKYAEQSDTCGQNDKLGFGECTVIATSGKGYSCSFNMSFWDGKPKRGGVSLRCDI